MCPEWTPCLGTESPGQTIRQLERAKGFEPSTPTLARSCSTPELHPHPRTGPRVALASRRAMPNAASECNSRHRLPLVRGMSDSRPDRPKIAGNDCKSGSTGTRIPKRGPERFKDREASRSGVGVTSGTGFAEPTREPIEISRQTAIWVNRKPESQRRAVLVSSRFRSWWQGCRTMITSFGTGTSEGMIRTTPHEDFRDDIRAG
jgi:hypothetical protein